LVFSYNARVKSVDLLASEALLLPKDQRLTLAHRILSSIEEADPGAEAAWEKEISERIRQYDAGKLKGISGEEVFREIDDALGR
jgi:putative addiction module component (TIGR02574 family)